MLHLGKGLLQGAIETSRQKDDRVSRMGKLNIYTAIS